MFQGYLLVVSLKNPGQNIFLHGLEAIMKEHGPLVPNFGLGFIITAVATITAGSHASSCGSASRSPNAASATASRSSSPSTSSPTCPAPSSASGRPIIGKQDASATDALTVLMLVVLLVTVIAGIIALTQAQRRIAIQYAKRVVGRKVYGGQTQYLPLKVNYAGVMPIIFAQAIVLFPSQIVSFMFPDNRNVVIWSQWLTDGWPYIIISTALIFFFSYFWVATMFQPTQIAEDLKKNGGYIPGIRPGKPTADFLDFTMSRLTFAGAVFLTLIYRAARSCSSAGWNIAPRVSQFFGGTSMLILVGVVLDVMRQVETHLLQRHYDGFLRKGKIRGRFDRATAGGLAANPTGRRLALDRNRRHHHHRPRLRPHARALRAGGREEWRLE